MKVLSLLPLAALASAIVVPDEAMTQQIVLEGKRSQHGFLSSAKDAFYNTLDKARNVFDDTIEKTREVESKAADTLDVLEVDAGQWLDAAKEATSNVATIYEESDLDHLFGHRDHHHKPNKTIYQLITDCEYTSKFAELLKDFPETVKVLNGTVSNITYFVPTNKAFEKIPEHHKKPSHEMIEKLLMYHGSPHFYPAGRVLTSHTLPSALNLTILDDQPQRLRVGLSLRGLTVNFYAKIVAVDIFATNGVIHAVEDFIIPPVPAVKAIELLPGDFSTLELALVKTGLGEAMAKDNKTAGTVFAPSNYAFKKLGPRLNAFLFSKYGAKYLKAVVEYHLVPNVVVYSDAYYVTKGGEIEGLSDLNNQNIPKRRIHAELPTALKGKSLSIDIIRFGGFIEMRLNGFTSVAVQDGIVENGVIHELSSVLMPPKEPGMMVREADDSMTIEEFKEAFEPYISD